MTFANRKFIGFLGAATVVIVAEYILVLSDGVIAGQMLGEKALGAANMLMPIFMVVSFFTWLLAVGTSIVYSDAMARMQRERAANLAGQGLVASVLLGLALGVTVFAVKGLYVGFMASDAETTGHALGYLNWYPLVVFLEAIDLLLLYLVYTDGGAVSCTVSYCAQVVVNIVLSYGLCAGKWGLPRLGMGGIALGTVAAYLSGVAMLLPRFFRRGRCGVRFTPKFLPNEFLRSLQLSFGDASSGLFQALLLFVATKYIILLWGPDTLPVATVAFFVVRLSLFFNGVGIALQPIETVYHGEGNTAGINGLVRFAACISVLEGLFLTVVVFVAPDLIASAVGIDSPEHVSEASHAARWTCVGLTGYALAYMLNSHYQYIGRPGRSVKLTSLAFFIVPVALLFAFGGRISGMNGVWVSIAAGPAIAVAMLQIRPLLRSLKSAKSRRKTHVWSVDASDPASCRKLLASIEKSLSREAPGETVQQILHALTLSLDQIRGKNGNDRRVHAEITVKPERDGVRVIVRDDGVHFAIEGLEHPVRHLPASGFNRNIFVLALPGDSFGRRYEVLRGYDLSPDEIKEIVDLEDRSFDARYHTTLEQECALFKSNREGGVVVRDRETGAIVAYMMILPVTDETYDLIRQGVLLDTALDPEKVILKYDSPGIYHIFFASVIVAPAHRSARMVTALVDAMVEDFIALAGRGIFADRMVADVVSGDGRKFCRLFGFEKVGESDHDSLIYEISIMPPRIRMDTATIRRFKAIYAEHLDARSQG